MNHLLHSCDCNIWSYSQEPYLSNLRLLTTGDKINMVDMTSSSSIYCYLFVGVVLIIKFEIKDIEMCYHGNLTKLHKQLHIIYFNGIFLSRCTFQPKPHVHKEQQQFNLSGSISQTLVVYITQ